MTRGQQFFFTFMVGALAGKVWGMWQGLVYVACVMMVGFIADVIGERRK